MIAYLKGILTAKSTGYATIEVAGVGYELAMSTHSLSKLNELGSPVLIYTYLQVKEDSLAMYGFLSTEEKELFEKLISVSGIGPKVAISALSAASPAQLKSAIANGDVSAVSAVPGIGKKTAQRIILELKGSLEQSLSEEGTHSRSEAWTLARQALLSMGFSSTEADLALKGAPDDASDSSLLQYALKKLGSR